MTAVIHVVTALERGGAQRNTLESAARLHDAGRPQLLVTGRAAALDDEAADRLGRRLLHLPDLVAQLDPVRDWLALHALTRMIDRAADRLGTPIIVHTHSSKAGILGRLAARAVRGVIVMHTVHGFGLEALGPRRAWLLEAAERIAAPAADVLIFVSEADRRRAETLGTLRGRRAELIRSGIDAEPFHQLRGDHERRARMRAQLGLAEGDPLVLTIANLKPQKDPLLHAAIFAEVHRRNPRARMAFLGDGPLRDEMEARLVALGLTSALTLPGFVADPRDHLAAADVFLLASAWEGLPRAVLEATAAGVPAVVRDTGWAADLGWTRSLRAVPSAAPPAAFADVVEEALRKPTRAARVPRAFTQQGMLTDLARLYDELVGAPRPVNPRPRGRRRHR